MTSVHGLARLSLPIVGLLACAHVAAFDLDISLADVQHSLDVRTVGDLGAGQNGIIDGAAAGLCDQGGKLQLTSATPLIATAQEAGFAYVVYRMEGGTVDLAPPVDQPAPGPRVLKALARRLASLPACELAFRGEPLVAVRNMVGGASLTDLVLLAVGNAQPVPMPRGQQQEPAQEAAAPVVGWKVEQGTSELSGTPSVLVTTSSIDDPRVSLALRCLDGRTAVYVVTGARVPYTENFEVEVTLQIDDREPRTEVATASDSREALFLRNPMAKAVLLLGAERYTVNYPDYNSETRTASFDTTGLLDHMATLRGACAW